MTHEPSRGLYFYPTRARDVIYRAEPRTAAEAAWLARDAQSRGGRLATEDEIDAHAWDFPEWRNE